MKLKITLNLGRGWPDFLADQVVEVPRDLSQQTADKLLSQGLATVVDEPKPKVTKVKLVEPSPSAKATAPKRSTYFRTPPEPASVEAEPKQETSTQELKDDPSNSG